MKKQISKKTNNAFGKKIYLLGRDEDGTNYWLEESDGIVVGIGDSDMSKHTPTIKTHIYQKTLVLTNILIVHLWVR